MSGSTMSQQRRRTREIVRTAHSLVSICALLQALAILDASAACSAHSLPSRSLPRPLRQTLLPKMDEAAASNESSNPLTLDSIRESLQRQEDTVIFSLLERSRFPSNPEAYSKSSFRNARFCGSVVEFVARETEAAQAKAGKFDNPEENAFFPANINLSQVHHKFPQVLHPPSSQININQKIWKMYFDELLPLFVAKGDDGNYASTAAADFVCLQALSRRIHYGKFVAEVKFRNASEEYTPLIRAKDKNALMKLLTSEKQEDVVKKRVEKKAMVFGQDVSVDDGNNNNKTGGYKVPPSVVAGLYGDWVIPLTKDVEVCYLLHRLD